MTQRNFTLTALLVPAALALAACQQPSDDSNIAIDNGLNAAEIANAEIETLPPNDASDGDAAGDSLPSSIPARFHGRWGLLPADCTSTRGDAKGLLTISAAGLAFYESRGTIGRVLGATASGFDASYGFSGEGQTWQRVERLTLVDDRLQRRTDAAPGQEPPVNLTYQRCAA